MYSTVHYLTVCTYLFLIQFNIWSDMRSKKISIEIALFILSKYIMDSNTLQCTLYTANTFNITGQTAIYQIAKHFLGNPWVTKA